MSVKCSRIFSRVLKPNSALFRLPTLKCYSIYSPSYVYPTFRKEDQDELLQEKTKKELEVAKVRATESDLTCSVFFDPDVNKFIRFILKKGDREKARRIVDDTFQIIKERQVKKYWKEEDPKERENIIINPTLLYKKALNNCKPVMEAMYIKRGGQHYNVPVSIRPNRATFLGVKFILTAGNEKTDSISFASNLATVIIQAAHNTGPAVQKKLNLHKLCDENRAYAHYRWG